MHFKKLDDTFRIFDHRRWLHFASLIGFAFASSAATGRQASLTADSGQVSQHETGHAQVAGNSASGAATASGNDGTLSLLSTANIWTQAQTIYGGIGAMGGNSSLVDLTGIRSAASYLSGAGSIYGFYPSIGYNPGDHQRAQGYINFVTSADASVSETGLSINARMDTGAPAVWMPSTAYLAGTLTDVNGKVYRATTGGISTSSGKGPSGTGSGIPDGSVIWAFQCMNQCNAKMPLFVSAVAGANGGKVWAADVALTLAPGWHGQFAPSFEVDMTNNSGADCPLCQNLFISGDAGTNRIGAGISLYSPSSTRYQWVNGYQATGARSVSGSAYYDATAADYSYQDAGTHAYGLYLKGIYSAAAALLGGPITLQEDYSRINLLPTSKANRNQWRILSSVHGTSNGDLAIQTTNDAFVSHIVTPIIAHSSGAVTLANTAQLTPTMFAALPVCTAARAGTLAYVADAKVAVTAWHQQVTDGGGTNKAFIACNGSGWFAFDY